MTIAERIKAERLRLQMNQMRFAAALGVPQPYVSKWERGAQKPSYQNAARLAKLTGRPVQDFAETPTLPDHGKRASIDALTRGYSDEDWQLIYDFAVDLRETSVERPAPARTAANATGKQRRGRSSGSAPAA